jgi:hypothetical protein
MPPAASSRDEKPPSNEELLGGNEARGLDRYATGADSSIREAITEGLLGLAWLARSESF